MPGARAAASRQCQLSQPLARPSPQATMSDYLSEVFARMRDVCVARDAEVRAEKKRQEKEEAAKRNNNTSGMTAMPLAQLLVYSLSYVRDDTSLSPAQTDTPSSLLHQRQPMDSPPLTVRLRARHLLASRRSLGLRQRISSSRRWDRTSPGVQPSRMRTCRKTVTGTFSPTTTAEWCYGGQRLVAATTSMPAGCQACEGHGRTLPPRRPSPLPLATSGG